MSGKTTLVCVDEKMPFVVRILVVMYGGEMNLSIRNVRTSDAKTNSSFFVWGVMQMTGEKNSDIWRTRYLDRRQRKSKAHSLSVQHRRES